VRVFDSGPGWILYHGRAEDYLGVPENFEALEGYHVITDPPYTDVPRNTKRMVEHEATDAVKAIVRLCVVQAASAIVITGSTAGTRAILPFEPRRILAIIQNMGTAVPIDAWMYGLQLANVYGPARGRSTMPSKPHFLLPPRSVARQPKPPDHPNALPPSLGAWLAGGLPGQKVIDPFCGGGGLIAGARAAGASLVIGIDVSAEWLEFARQKLNRAPERLWPPLRKHAASEPMLDGPG